MAKKVVAAMSGGVDSAVAAYLMKEQGFEVIGITLRLAPDSEQDVRTGRCCSLDDMSDARMVCQKLGIAFYAIDAQAKFKEAVFEPFVKAYQNGITPIPCLACNHTVKFGDLFRTAQQLDADIATGHYARMIDYQGQRAIARPFDRDRDQTYYLYGTARQVLPHLHFPLGELPKPEVRKIAQKLGLLVHDKKDSHEICFVPDGDHARVVERATGKNFSGDIVNEEGKVIGHHKGIHRFTIGQRRGLNVSARDRQFVTDLDAENQRVVLGARESLRCKNVLVSQMSYLVPLDNWPKHFQVKVRARSEATPARLSEVSHEGQNMHINFDDDVFGIALGQAAVFYHEDIMLGGGILTGRLDGAFKRILGGSHLTSRSLF